MLLLGRQTVPRDPSPPSIPAIHISNKTGGFRTCTPILGKKDFVAEPSGPFHVYEMENRIDLSYVVLKTTDRRRPCVAVRSTEDGYCNACLDRPAGPVWSFRVCTCMMMDSRVVSDAYDQRKPQSHNSYASSLDDVNACVYIYCVRYRHSPEPDVTNYVSTSKIGK